MTAPHELPIQRRHCQIIDCELLNHDVSRVRLRLPGDKPVRWYAGQYLTLELACGTYPFSIATAPGGREAELHVRHGEANHTARVIMAELQTCSTVTVRIPGGKRFIDQPPAVPLWFICGSTGFAPVKAMMERLIDLDYGRPVRLFWGARTEDDLYLARLLPRWRRQLRDFRSTTILSESVRPGHATGLAHEAALQALVDPDRPLFYVGGSPAMCWAVFDALVAAGVPAGRIHSDAFDYAPR